MTKKTWYTLDWAKATVEDIKQIIQNGEKVNTFLWFKSNHEEKHIYPIAPKDYDSERGDTFYNIELHEGRTPLALAILAKNKPVISYLLEQKADLNTCVQDDAWGRYHSSHIWCPTLSLAIRKKDRDIINLCLSHIETPFNFEHCDYLNEFCLDRNHPIIVAIECNDKKTFQKLLSYDLPKKQEESLKHELMDDIFEKKGLWDNFYTFLYKKEKEQRKSLRKSLAKASQEKNSDKKIEIISQLRGKYSLRNEEAQQYRRLRRLFDSKTAQCAHEALRVKRKKSEHE